MDEVPEYNVTFRKVLVGNDPEVCARVSDEDERLVETVEAIRSQIVERSKGVHGSLDAIPNGHFMEIEFLAEGESIQGVVFLTPYLPEKFVATLHRILRGVGIENMV